MKLAFTFPGQGSQSVGMLASYGALPELRATFEEASGVLGVNLHAIVEAGPAETLNLTVNTQPAMLATDVALYRAWRARGGAQPGMAAGHSLGEIAALVAAQVLDFSDAIRLVRLRAEAMQRAVPEGQGGMAAILGLDDEAVRAVCADAAQGAVLDAVNYNAPGQVVIAGDKAAVERAAALAKDRGAKRALPLPVSVPSHCALMKPAADELRAALQGMILREAAFPVLHNADVASHGEADRVRDALARQLFSPVRWVETLRAMADAGATHIVECGPGKVLMGLNKRIVESAQHFTLNDTATLDAALAATR